MQTYRPRIVDRLLDTYLAASPAVQLAGAHASGKTQLVCRWHPRWLKLTVWEPVLTGRLTLLSCWLKDIWTISRRTSSPSWVGHVDLRNGSCILSARTLAHVDRLAGWDEDHLDRLLELYLQDHRTLDCPLNREMVKEHFQYIFARKGQQRHSDAQQAFVDLHIAPIT